MYVCATSLLLLLTHVESVGYSGNLMISVFFALIDIVSIVITVRLSRPTPMVENTSGSLYIFASICNLFNFIEIRWRTRNSRFPCTKYQHMCGVTLA